MILLQHHHPQYIAFIFEMKRQTHSLCRNPVEHFENFTLVSTFNCFIAQAWAAKDRTHSPKTYITSSNWHHTLNWNTVSTIAICLQFSKFYPYFVRILWIKDLSSSLYFSWFSFANWVLLTLLYLITNTDNGEQFLSLVFSAFKCRLVYFILWFNIDFNI